MPSAGSLDNVHLLGTDRITMEMLEATKAILHQLHEGEGGSLGPDEDTEAVSAILCTDSGEVLMS